MIVVTGAAGYIGGQIALRLVDAGQKVLGIDRRLCHSGLSDAFTDFVHGDFDSDESYKKLLDVRPEAVIHCAGTSLVGPSVKHPGEYYTNNVAKTLHLLDFMCNAMPKTRFIFSSSAAVYGEPIMNPCHEVDPCEPISPYGESKRMVEQILESYHRAYGLDYVAFRYFNACGADPEGRHGQEPNATHIIARVLESIRDNQEFTLYGNDYPTADGTCIRDYVHVDDIATAHALALYHKIPAGVYNLGSNQGTSNHEIIVAAERVTGKHLKVAVGEKRAGDPPSLTTNPTKFNIVAGEWQHYKLDDMIQHAWNWYNK